MVYTNLRDWLQRLHQDGQLKHISREVNLKHELAAVGKDANGKFAVCFDNVVGENLPGGKSKMPVIVGANGSREMMAKALGLERKEDLARHYYHAQCNPIEPIVIEKKDAPCKEIIKFKEEINLFEFPAPVHHALDAGQYIDANILVSANPKTGKRNVSVHRFQIKDKNHLGICIFPKHLNEYFKMSEASNMPLEIAICIGVDPVLMLASQAKLAFDEEEYGVAGALYGKALELVHCETVNLDVPAQSEIVLEGRILPNIREMEGPFGEFPRNYGWAEPRQIVEITAITMRKNPIFVDIVPATNDHTLLGAIVNEGIVLNAIKASVSGVKNVVMTPGPSARYCAVVQIKKQKEGEAKNCICAALGCNEVLKKVIVVDEDVNPYDYEDIDWATTLRVRPDQDILIIPGMKGNRSDPSTDEGYGAKIGIDATVPLDAQSEKNLRITIPNEENIHVEDYID